ncbi:hypothetical protein D0Y65_031822 [Glycine soja]|uniref:Heme-binding protein 2 n=1 Tax=Glycine soja TaxID=3848 RepID=A0A445IA53_GLYSO|nr:hypothetical protein D0Y65_031822 [Glycine soja]
MAASTIITLKFSFLLSLLLSVSLLGGVRTIPPTCNRIECPTHDVIESTSPIQDISLVQATRRDMLEFILSHNSFAIANATYRIIIFARKTFNKGCLFDYIQGKNNYKQRIEMIAPVITEVSPSDGPFCKSSFVFSFFVPKLNQANPPPAKGLRVQRWNNVYVAARQFAAALRASIAGTEWSSAIDKSHRAGHASVYTVAQYNDPFEYENVNEIWFLFEMESERHAM